jgi:hypothetical protein
LPKDFFPSKEITHSPNRIGQLFIVNYIKHFPMEPHKSINRHAFLKQSLAGAAGILLINSDKVFAQDNAKQEKPAPISLEIVKEFVGASHGKFDRVKEMLENDHLLLHVSYDWGGGDYESGIEAAGHVGNKEIANYLMSKGARYNIYLACMLGHLDTVKQVLTFNPSLLNSKGAHGFTMLHHAQRGGQEAAAVVEFLQSLGAKETKINFYARA